MAAVGELADIPEEIAQRSTRCPQEFRAWLSAYLGDVSLKGWRLSHRVLIPEGPAQKQHAISTAPLRAQAASYRAGDSGQDQDLLPGAEAIVVMSFIPRLSLVLSCYRLIAKSAEDEACWGPYEGTQWNAPLAVSGGAQPVQPRLARIRPWRQYVSLALREAPVVPTLFAWNPQPHRLQAWVIASGLGACLRTPWKVTHEVQTILKGRRSKVHCVKIQALTARPDYLIMQQGPQLESTQPCLREIL